MSGQPSLIAKPAGSCKHRPISNGWSSISARQPEGHFAVVSTTAWCGYCRAFVEIDAEWRAKFVAHDKFAPPLIEAAS